MVAEIQTEWRSNFDEVIEQPLILYERYPITSAEEFEIV